MKVLVVNNAVPFIRGGAEELADHLVRNLNATPGVEAELLRIPFAWEPQERLIEEMLAAQSMRVHNIDLMIGLKWPAYLLPWERKRLWLLHQFRQAYDLHTPGEGYLGDERGLRIAQAVRRNDDACFAGCERIFTNSPVTQERLRRFNGAASETLYPPLNDAELFGGGADGGYIFAGGRVGPGKRQHLLVEAMATAPRDLRLLIAGPPDSDAYVAPLKARIAELGLEDRVELRLGFHPRADIAAWANNARACAYIPYDEDSLGYVTMEAFAAGKPVLTTTDSGGLLEIVSEATGAVVAPTPEALAEGLARLNDPALAAERGAAAAALWAGRGLTWARTVETLLG
jgi:glycosyltransferase involved in cell wall biosynthesis